MLTTEALRENYRALMNRALQLGIASAQDFRALCEGRMHGTRTPEAWVQAAERVVSGLTAGEVVAKATPRPAPAPVPDTYVGRSGRYAASRFDPNRDYNREEDLEREMDRRERGI